MTLIEIRNAPKLNELWFEEVRSECLLDWMWDDNGVIYVGF